MAATEAKIGFGALLKIANNASPQVMTTIGEIKSLSGPSIGRDAVDATHSESPDGWREFISGLKDGGEFSAEIHFIPGSTGNALLLEQFDNAALSVCEATIPTIPPWKWSFSAVLTGFESDEPIDDVMVANVTFKVSGKPTLAQA